jgi:anion-transporting  ArsA/GET3 family ATPase
VFENRAVRYFLKFLPSIQELVMLGKALFHVRERRPDGSWKYERVVLDAPATGHALTFLSVPEVVLRTVPPGPLANEARWMRDLLADPATTAALLVSTPEELPLTETLELKVGLEARAQVRTAAIVLNGHCTERFEVQDEASLAAWPQLQAVARAHRRLSEQSEQAANRLRKATGLPVLRLEQLVTQELPLKVLNRWATELESDWSSAR